MYNTTEKDLRLGDKDVHVEADSRDNQFKQTAAEENTSTLKQRSSVLKLCTLRSGFKCTRRSARCTE